MDTHLKNPEESKTADKETEDSICHMVEKCGIQSKLADTYKQQSTKEIVQITIGNTGCDEDSFVGSHVLGLIEERIPVVNMPRKIFEHKLDLCRISQIMGLSLDDLVFLETEGTKKVLARGKDKIMLESTRISAWLVDFSDLDDDLLKKSKFQIDRVIDHRKVLYKKELFDHSVNMWIELNAGSCCSLIFHYVNIHYADTLSANPEAYMFVLLLAIPILTDTTFLTERVHGLDRSAIQHILSFTRLSTEKIRIFHESVKKLLYCEDKAETGTILQMCHKKIEYPDGSGRSFGMSTVRYSYDKWIERDTKKVFLSEIDKFVTDNKYEFIIINNSPPGIREFFIYLPPGSDFVEEVLYKDEPVQKREILNDPELTVYKKNTFFVTKMIIPDILDYLMKLERSKQ